MNATDSHPPLTRIHFNILLVFIIVFTAFTAFCMSQQSIGDRRDSNNISATLLTATGPFTGAIARNFQSCCWQFSLRLAPYCGTILMLGIAAQFVPLPFRRGQGKFRMVAWVLGLLGWFLGAPVSLLDALS